MVLTIPVPAHPARQISIPTIQALLWLPNYATEILRAPSASKRHLLRRLEYLAKREKPQRKGEIMVINVVF